MRRFIIVSVLALSACATTQQTESGIERYVVADPEAYMTERCAERDKVPVARLFSGDTMPQGYNGWSSKERMDYIHRTFGYSIGEIIRLNDGRYVDKQRINEYRVFRYAAANYDNGGFAAFKCVEPSRT
jgi:hypothetical protein